MKTTRIVRHRLRIIGSTVHELLFNTKHLQMVSYVLLVIELVLNIFIIRRVNYTEIDWRAYMQEVEGALNGTTDYAFLRGETGPLVYPAGFVYIFSALYLFTDQGRNIQLAQYVFAVIYVLLLHVVFSLYVRTRRVPPYVLLLMSASAYRIHSIFVLRLFNDGVAMLILYMALALFCKKRWTLGCFMFSAAVSVKMNILLFAPALFFILLSTNGYLRTALNLGVCVAVQLVAAFPFLLGNARSYALQAFNFGRVFEYRWTVNWRCVPEWLFVDPAFHVALLLLHISTLIAFLPTFIRYSRIQKLSGANGILFLFVPDQILLPMFAANFIGITFARSLHYQFYVWYYHSLPYLLWSLPLTTLAKLLLWGLLEMAWNTYPSTVLSSLTIHACHGTILVALWFLWPKQCHVVLGSTKAK